MVVRKFVGKGGPNGIQLSLFQMPVERQRKFNNTKECCSRPNQAGERQIEPREGVKGAEDYLGLDDIPPGSGSGMKCWLHVANRFVEGH